MRDSIKYVLASLLFMGAVSAAAQEEEEPGKRSWEGHGELGLVNTTGNTKSTTVNLKLEFVWNTEHWRHRFSGSALAASEDGTKDTERYTVEVQSDRALSERSYLFGALRWDADKFGAYDPQQTLTAGYGRELMKSEKHMLKGEIGAGYRRLEETESGLTSKEAIARFLLEDKWQVFESTSWTNRLLIETGADNTFTQFNTGLQVAMTTHFALKLGFEVRNNTKIPPGESEKTDTTTTANLVYKF